MRNSKFPRTLLVQETSPGSLGKIGYYEMLLWIQVEDVEKIHELCSTFDDSEHYLDALCEKDRKENLQRLLEIVDITKVSSRRLLTNIFSYLGRSLLESVAMKFLRELSKDGVKTVPNLSYLCILRPKFNGEESPYIMLSNSSML